MLGRLDEPSPRVERDKSAASMLEEDEGSANESPATVDARRLGANAACGLNADDVEGASSSAK